MLIRASGQRLRDPAERDRDHHRDRGWDQEEHAPVPHMRDQATEDGAGRSAERHEDQHPGDRLLADGEGVPITEVDQSGGKDAAGDAAGDEPRHEQQRQTGRQGGKQVGHCCADERGPHDSHPAEAIGEQTIEQRHQPVGQVIKAGRGRGGGQRDPEAGRDRDQHGRDRKAIGHGREGTEVQGPRCPDLRPGRPGSCDGQLGASRTPISSRCTSRSAGSS